MSTDIQSEKSALPAIKFMAVGGAGIGVAEAFLRMENACAEIAVVDTDLEALKSSAAQTKIVLGKNSSTKFGTGGDISLGKEAALASAQELKNFIKQTDVLFVAGALGGGTASMAVPLIAKLAAEENIALVLALCIMPLSIEGEEKQTLAISALRYTGRRVHAAIELPNDLILAKSQSSVEEAFSDANNLVAEAAHSMCEMLLKKGIVNIDFPALKRVFSERGRRTLFANAKSEAKGDVGELLEKLRHSPFLSEGASKADSLFVSLRCPRGFEMNKMQQILEAVSSSFTTSGKLAFGVMTSPGNDEALSACIIGQLPKTVEFLAPKAGGMAQAQKTAQTQKEPLAGGGKDCVKEKVPHVGQSQTAQVENRQKQKDADAQPDKKAQADPSQSEFSFMEKNQQRGFFEDTPPNMKNGEDLDVPTFMRKNIKISLQV